MLQKKTENFKYDFFLQKTGRVYKIGNKYCEIPSNVVVNFQEWNTNFPERFSREIDEICVSALLLVLLSKEEISNSIVGVDTLNFIRGKDF